MIINKKITKLAARMLLILMLVSVITIPETKEVSAAVTVNASGVISTSGGAYLRKKPSKSSKRLALLKNNKPVVITKEVFTKKSKSGAKYKWYYVVAGKKRGYVRSDLVKVTQYGGKQAWTKTGLNYRAGAGKSMNKIGSLAKNTSITLIMQAKAYNSKKAWYRIKIGASQYYVCGDYITFKKPAVEAQPKDPNELARTTVPSAASKKVADNSVAWAKKIAADNSFHYGNGKHAHHCGCYFCGTQPSTKKKHVVEWQKTYCCNTFVHAAYAHGGGDATMLKVCKRGDAYDWNSFKKTSLFKHIGHPDQSLLIPGDVLCWNGHMAMYAGNGNIVEAGLEDYGVHGKRWNDSISVNSLTAKEYKRYTHVYRYIAAK